MVDRSEWEKLHWASKRAGREDQLEHVGDETTWHPHSLTQCQRCFKEEED